MRLNVSLEDISDGKLYDLNDMVKADTRGCGGCSACCHGVENTIVLNPFDMYQIIIGTGLSYNELIHNKIECHEEEKITLPHLKMQVGSEACGFLNEEDRCSIHNHRPSICRIFPLGRFYDEGNFKYIFQTGECIKPNLTKVKVKKWIDIDNYNENKVFILSWYNFLKALKWRVKFVHDPKELVEMNNYLIDTFYRKPWLEDEEFYLAYYSRLKVAKDRLSVI